MASDAALKNRKTADRDMTQGSVWKHIILFSLPLIAGNLVQQLYNTVDSIVVGNFVGKEALAATGAVFPIMFALIGFFSGFAMGAGVVISQYFGANDDENVSAAVQTTMAFSFILCALLSVAGVLMADPLLRLMQIPDDVFGQASTYLRICFAGLSGTLLYNMTSGIQRAVGDSRHPLYFLIFSAVLNTVLDLVFVISFHMGIAGAAWATVIGQVIAWGSAVRYLGHFKRVTLKREYFVLSLRRIGRTLTMGMSNGLTQAAITLVHVILNRSLIYYGGLSVYGADIPLAACGVVLKINSLVIAFMVGMHQGMQPIVGFNYGARRFDRVKATYKLVIGCVLTVTILALLIFELIPDRVLMVFGRENDLYMEFATRFMRIFLVMVPLNGVQMISSNFFSAIGKPVRGALLALTRQVFFLIPLMLILPLFLGLDGVLFASPTADLIAFVVVLIFITGEFREMTRLENESQKL